jgi:diguanylate cyclase (GGDEF)-like protein/PAS domain S-box-containing protein
VNSWKTKDALRSILIIAALLGVLLLKIFEFLILQKLLYWYLHKPFVALEIYLDIISLSLIMVPFMLIVTKQKKTLKEAEDHYKVLAEDSLVGIYTYSDGKITYVNQRFLDILGYQRDEVMNFDFHSLVLEEDHPNILESLRRKMEGIEKTSVLQVRGVKKDQSMIDVELHGTITISRGKPMIIGSILDITDRKRNERLLNEFAFYDQLTGLPNRRFLEKKLVDLQDNKIPMAILFADLDGFKKVNDSFGHHAGDLLLIEIGKRLVKCAVCDDSVFRFAGDEFIILLSNTERNSVEEAAAKLIEEVNQPLLINGHVMCPSISVGVTLFPDHGKDPEVLLRNADQAMYQAKLQGKNTYIIWGPVPSLL